MESESSRITGKPFGAAHGARGGDGKHTDHGVRGAWAIIGLINVPASMRAITEIAEIARLRTTLGRLSGKARQDAQASLAGAERLLEAARVKPLAGRLPVNHRYAGSWVPADKLPEKYRTKGLYFTKEGYPDFGPYAVTLPNGRQSVQIRLTGQHHYDRIAASRAAGFDPPRPPKGYTWHHYQDGTTMQLVPLDLHESIRHTGGTATYKHQTGNIAVYRE